MAQVDPVPVSHDAVGAVTEAQPRLSDLSLARRLGVSAWLARAGDGTPVVARWLAPCATSPPSPIMVGRALALAAVDPETLVPVTGVALHRNAIWLVSELRDGLALGRFVELVGLSASQVAVVASDVLVGLSELHARDLTHGRLHADNVLIGVAGDVRLADWAVTTLLLTDVPRQRASAGSGGQRPDRVALDVAAARRLILALVDGVRGGVPRGAPSGSDLAAALETATGVPGLLAVLDGWLPEPSVTGRVRRELGALVTAAQQPAGAAVVPALRMVEPAAPAPRPAVVRRPARSSGSGLWKLVAATTVLFLVVGAEAALFGGRIVRDIQTLRAPVSSASPAVPSAQAGPVVKLPTLGVSAAGIVTGVDARALRTCAPGRSCDVQVTVQLTPQRRPTRLRWHLAAVDLCTARARTLGHSAITVPAQADHAVVVQTVQLPRATALAVGAVTDRPARAASTPFPAPSGHVTC